MVPTLTPSTRAAFPKPHPGKWNPLSIHGNVRVLEVPNAEYPMLYPAVTMWRIVFLGGDGAVRQFPMVGIKRFRVYYYFITISPIIFMLSTINVKDV